LKQEYTDNLSASLSQYSQNKESIHEDNQDSIRDDITEILQVQKDNSLTNDIVEQKAEEPKKLF
ncbi:hypothetical protein A3Q56_03322, partial [Intoshia linei]